MSLVNMPPFDLAAILAPLNEKHPAGAFDEEDGTFQGIDHEMIKLGSLHDTSLDWNYVDEASRQYLASQCKHFRIAGHLITARIQRPSWRGWAESAGVLAGMIEHYWETGFPKPGPTGYPAKRRMVAILVERMGEALSKLETDDAAKPDQDVAKRALDRLQACAEHARLEVSMLTRLESKFTRRVEETRFPALEPALSTMKAQAGQAISEAYFISDHLPKPGDERENKRTLLAMAEFINQQDAYDTTGYLLRRFALWGHLTTAPMARREHRTELMGVPSDLVEGYQDALSANNVSPVLLQRVEKSVTSSPYWLYGSFLAAAIAQRLEMAEVAASIRLAAERFVLRIPALKTLQFADGRPFVDGETLAWLSGRDAQAGAVSNSREYDSLREELFGLMEAGGVEALLRRLEEIQAETDEPRHQCHVMALAADLLAARGFSWLAEGLYRTARSLMQNTPTPTWEPTLFNHLVKEMGGGMIVQACGTQEL